MMTGGEESHSIRIGQRILAPVPVPIGTLLTSLLCAGIICFSSLITFSEECSGKILRGDFTSLDELVTGKWTGFEGELVWRL